MRGAIPFLIAGVLALTAACGGDDAEPSSEPTAEPTAEPTTGNSDATTGESTDSVAAPLPGEIFSEACEDEPDPADYPEDRVPPALRPCTLPTELVVTEVKPGSGHEATAGDTVIVDYTGMRSEDGFVFDTSYMRNMPIDFVLGTGGVIQGWDQGFLGAQAGQVLKLDIPTELAYGDNPPGSDIRPGDALTFVAEVRAIVPATTVEDAPLDVAVEPSIGATEVTTVDVTVGEGAPLTDGQTAIVHMLLVRGDNEVVLFNTWERNDPIQIVMDVGYPLPGIFEGIQGMNVGGMRVISMPPDMAFGPEGETSLGLPAATDLIVVAEVVGAY